MRKLVLAVSLTALAAPAPALALDRDVTATFNRFNPGTRLALTGDTVRWTNVEDRQVVHNVTPRPGTNMPKSPELNPGDTWQNTFSAPGLYRYYCTHHAGMTGTVSVRDLHLTGPTWTLTHGAAGRFTGLAPENEQVVLRSADGAEVAAATAAADGSFAVRVPMIRPGQYYATTAGRASARVKVAVRPKLALTSRRSGRRLVLTVKATPTQERAPVVVQRLQRSRWVKIAGGRLNASSKATFRVARKAMKIRARTTRGVGGYAAATSRTLRVR